MQAAGSPDNTLAETHPWMGKLSWLSVLNLDINSIEK